MNGIPRMLVVDNGSLSTEVLVREISARGWNVIVEDHSRCASMNGFDAVVLTGTAVPVWRGAYDSLLTPITRCDVPILGICGGLHILARAFGSDIELTAQAVGRHDVTLVPDEPLFRNLPERVELFQRHTYQVRDIPDGFCPIAWSDTCSVEGMRHHDKPLYGMQAHVEFRRHGREILGNFLAIAAQH